MASAVTTNQVFGRTSLKLYDHDPGANTAVVVSGDGGTTKNYLPMLNYGNFVLVAMNSVSTSSSGPTLVDIVAATDSSGTNKTIIVSSGTVASVTVGDNVCVECSAEQIEEVGRAAGLAFTHVTGQITCSNSGDECVVLMGRFNAKSKQSALTANNIT
jgi:hypothetical protein